MKWIFERANGKTQALETPIGFIPRPEDLDLPSGFKKENLDQLFSINPKSWLSEIEETREYFKPFTRFPSELSEQMDKLEARLKKNL